ncbi:hypothetical protein SpAn4DRAFT_2417 [Sporomusa ovata]|uniref:Uncharacterized protein n=1 Tax=Sporomusa ovata TaxID=2378 RepID=A0A0U1L0W6_9FIRM|nr:hypothetical protein SpAn4DRAFT_2417 [Sporomusa ovata]
MQKDSGEVAGTSKEMDSKNEPIKKTELESEAERPRWS